MRSGRVVVATVFLAMALGIPIVTQAQAQSLPDRVAALEAAVSTLQGQVSTLQSQVAALQANPALGLGPHVSVVQGPINDLAGPHIIFTGANVHIRSGSGASDDNIRFGGTPTGLGNLVVGYNEQRTDPELPAARTGSHNFINGPLHDFSSAGGLVAGVHHTVSGLFATVSGGFANTASAQHATVSGGQLNTASADSASVSGGFRNTASGPGASVSGGRDNTASGDSAAVSGGRDNTASHFAATVSGGTDQVTSFSGQHLP